MNVKLKPPTDRCTLRETGHPFHPLTRRFWSGPGGHAGVQYLNKRSSLISLPYILFCSTMDSGGTTTCKIYRKTKASLSSMCKMGV